MVRLYWFQKRFQDIGVLRGCTEFTDVLVEQTKRMTMARRRSRVSFATGIEEAPETVRENSLVVSAYTEEVVSPALHNDEKPQYRASDIGNSASGQMGEDLHPELEAIPNTTELPRTNSERSILASQSPLELDEIGPVSKHSEPGIMPRLLNAKSRRTISYN